MRLSMLTGGCFLCLIISACTSYGGAADPAPAAGLRNLRAIDFAKDVPLNTDPAAFDLEGGTVTFDGGVAETRGIMSLYYSDISAWMPHPGSTSEITFESLNVQAVRFYFAHRGTSGASLTALSADGTELGTVDSFAATQLGDSRAVFEINGGDMFIARLVLETPDGVSASLDHLVISVPEQADNKVTTPNR